MRDLFLRGLLAVHALFRTSLDFTCAVCLFLRSRMITLIAFLNPGRGFHQELEE